MPTMCCRVDIAKVVEALTIAMSIFWQRASSFSKTTDEFSQNPTPNIANLDVADSLPPR